MTNANDIRRGLFLLRSARKRDYAHYNSFSFPLSLFTILLHSLLYFSIIFHGLIMLELVNECENASKLIICIKSKEKA